MKYNFVINGRKDKIATKGIVVKQISELKEHIDYNIYVTEGIGDATRHVRVYCDLHPQEETCFVACGGDGTINEVASGLVGFEHKTLAILSYGGTGNDFVRYYPEYKFDSIARILDGTDQKIDIMKVNDNYAINICNFGFDSYVCSTANSLSAQGVSDPYRKGIIKAILIGRFNRIKVVADGEKIGRRRMLLCTLANNSHVGGGFHCAPRSKNNDGLIDLCYVKPMSLLNLVKIMPTYQSGKHFDDKKCLKKMIYRQARHVEVSSHKLIELCLDGEMLPGVKFNIDIMPSAITLRLPKTDSSN